MSATRSRKRPGRSKAPVAARTRGPLSGPRKSEAIRSVAAQSSLANLKVKREFRIAADAVPDGIGLVINGATVVRNPRDRTAPVAVVDDRGRVGFRIPARPEAVYFFDCGVSGANRFRFTLFENGGGTVAGGEATASLDRLLFAHVFASDKARDLLVNFSSIDGGDFTFTGCKVTELAPALRNLGPASNSRATLDR